MNKYLKRSFLLIITLFIVTLVSNGISLKSIVHVYAAEKPVSGNFEYEILEDGTISIIRYTGNAAKVEFPSTLKNKKVTRIAPYDYSVFTDKNRNNVVSVIIPEGVTTIWDFAFSGCEKLKSVTLPDSLLGIDDWSFSNCRKLTGIKLPDHLQYIGQSAFANCTSLKKIIIPDSVDRIGDSYFNTTDSGNVDFYGDYGHTWINEGNIAAAFDGCDNLTSIRLPKNISAFALAHCKNLESITIPKGIEIVALRDCPKLKKINLSDSITDLYINECNSLLSLQVPNGLEQLNIRDCIGLKKVNIPESIANISLTGCAKIKSIRLTDSVTVIKDEAFMGCKSLQDINIPVSVSKVGKDILRDTAWYNKQKSGLIYKDKWCIGYKGDRTRIKSLTIAKGTKGIADKLTSTEETFNKIGYNSYEQILNSFDSLEKVALSDSVEFIGEDAFLRCDKLKSITLSKNLKEIGDEAFYGCSKLTTIKIPGNLVGIGDYAFADCTELENFNLPESIEHIGGAAFHSTGWLKKQKNGIVYKDNWIICYKGTMPGKCSLDIRKGTTGIADGAFSAQLNSSNKNLKSITIPDTIRYIGIMAFSKSGLEKVILPDNIEGLEGTFLSCSSLKEVQLPRNLIYLGERTFMNCDNLTAVNLPADLKEIGRRAFWMCTQLSDISISQKVETIGYQAFYRCLLLGNIVIPESTGVIEEEAFLGAGLDSVSVLSKDVKLGVHSFGYKEEISFGDDISGVWAGEEFHLSMKEMEMTAGAGYEKSYVLLSGYSGTTIEVYAKTNGFDFTAISEQEKLLGDTSTVPLQNSEQLP